MKQTKKQKAAEIAAMYMTVAKGGRMQFRCNEKGWMDEAGPNLSSDLSYFRAIPARAKKP